ncbi:Growth arrest and DNA damage-inducible proteins-interacting protein 1 [Nymphon striatum]|nr:Growth arrest and DNA damage-inducible proteins-interacting protein 1 [Nymphon striatum]
MAETIVSRMFCYKLGNPSRVSKLLTNCVFRLNASNTNNVSRNYCSDSKMDDHEREEDEINLIRNKSKLPSHIKQIYLDDKPYPFLENIDKSEPNILNTIKYQRSLYGRFGQESGVNPGIMWPSVEALQDMKEFDKKFYPSSLNEMMVKVREKKAEAAKLFKEREEEVERNLALVDQARANMLNRIAKQEQMAKVKHLQKEKMIEEVREYIGYDMDPRDPRFTELLEAKEKEKKKVEKESKKKEKEEKVLARYLEYSSPPSQSPNIETTNQSEEKKS